MTTQIKIDTGSYNARRYGKPWIARVTFSTPKGDYSWGDWIGQVNGGNGSEGMLVITADESDIIARGQKDFRGSKETRYYQVHNGELVYLEGGKAEAYKLATAQS
jgi:hypothetical protein